MLEAAVSALAMLFTPMHMLMFSLGILFGLLFGILPGLDVLFGMAVLLPFCLVMDPRSMLPLILGMASIAGTSGPIPSILIGAPGEAGNMATIMDGFPMAQRGEAGKALGAAFTSSLIGGLFGALVLTVSIPIFRPLVLLFGSPEFLALCILGMSLVSVLGGRYPFRGLAVAGLGMLFANIGLDPILGLERWSFGILYLESKVSIVPVALGFFALAEIIDLVSAGTSISRTYSSEGKWDGFKETFRHKKLVLSASGVGALVGFMPALGSGVATWISYAWTIFISKPRDKFGKGDIRGVIGCEAADNACLGGDLIPTLAFGIPGGTLMALMLSAFWILGLKPGPILLTKQLNLVYLMIWTIALSNILGAVICFLFTDYLAKLAMVRIQILAPLIIMLVFGGALVNSKDIGDLIVLVIFALLGWGMKRLDWSRPPFLMGFILGPLIERYYFSSTMIYGYQWVFRPAVLIIFALTALCIYAGIRIQHTEKQIHSMIEGASSK